MSQQKMSQPRCYTNTDTEKFQSKSFYGQEEKTTPQLKSGIRFQHNNEEDQMYDLEQRKKNIFLALSSFDLKSSELNSNKHSLFDQRDLSFFSEYLDSQIQEIGQSDIIKQLSNYNNFAPSDSQIVKELQNYKKMKDLFKNDDDVSNLKKNSDLSKQKNNDDVSKQKNNNDVSKQKNNDDVSKQKNSSDLSKLKDIIKNDYSIQKINSNFKCFIQETYMLIFRKLIHSQMLQIEEDYQIKYSKQKYCENKVKYFKEQLNSLVPSFKKDLQSFHESSFSHLFSIYMYNDLISYQQLFGITSSTSFVSDYEILKLKQKIIKKKFTPEKKVPKIKPKKNPQTLLSTLYFQLCEGRVMECYLSIIQQRKTPFYNQYECLFEATINFIQKREIDGELKLLIAVFESQTYDGIDEQVQKILKSSTHKDYANLDLKDTESIMTYFSWQANLYSKCAHSEYKEEILKSTNKVKQKDIYCQLPKDDQQNNNKDNNSGNDNQNNNPNNHPNNNQNNQPNDNQNNNHPNNNQNNDNEEIHQIINGNQQRQQQELLNEKIQDRKIILSIDGGGVKGIIQLYFLSALERLLPNGQTCNDIFDFIGGTSIGGIIALALRIGKSAQETLSLLLKFFQDGIFTYGYCNKIKTILNCSSSFNPDSTLIDKLKLIFGNKKLRDLTKNTLITSCYRDKNNDGNLLTPVCFIRYLTFGGQQVYNMCGMQTINRQFDNENPVIFQEQPYEDFYLWQIAACTSAAFPFIKSFELPTNPGQVFFDGGFLFNNVDLLLIQFIKQNQNQAELQNYSLLSIGATAQQQIYRPQQNHDSFFVRDSKVRFLIRYKCRGLQKKIEEIENHLRYLLEIKKNTYGFQYHRVTPPALNNNTIICLDDTRIETLDLLQSLGHRLIRNTYTNWQNLGQFLNINIAQSDVSITQNMEEMYRNEYNTANDYIRELQESIITLHQHRFLRELQNGQREDIEQVLINHLLQIKVRDAPAIKMIDQRGIFFFLKYFFQGDEIYRETKHFQGALQLAAGLGFISAIKEIMNILRRNEFQDIHRLVTEQIGKNQWNALIAASANNQTLAFLQLCQYIFDEIQDNDLIVIDQSIAQYLTKQISQEIKNTLQQTINRETNYKQYNFVSNNYYGVLEIANEKHRNVINWYIS